MHRFHKTRPFWAHDVHLLIENSLVDAIVVPSIAQNPLTESGRTLVVRRPIREYLHSHISEVEAQRLSKGATAIYFGENWSVKGIRPHKEIRFEDRNCGAARVGNANLMLLRTVRDALQKRSPSQLKAAYDLSCNYFTMLGKAPHYEGITQVAPELIQLFESVGTSDVSLLKYKYAQALRMSDDTQKAIDVLVEIRDSIPNNLKQDMLLTLTLAYQSQEMDVEAAESAKECIRIAPKNGAALQAQATLITVTTEGDSRLSQLSRLEKKARQRKVPKVANNIALTQAQLGNGSPASKERYASVMKMALADNDSYNYIRATVLYSNLHLKEGQQLSDMDVRRIIEAYHYLYGENMKALFDICHDVLWHVFEAGGELSNLTRLFRHSSLVWRVRGRASKENKYIARLIKIHANQLSMDSQTSNREIAYFLNRAMHALGKEALMERLALE